MSIVIIAEKTDVALAIANALTDAYKRCEGYLMGNNGLLITWTQGHLLRIPDPGELKSEWEDWSWDTLPIIPPYLLLKPIDKNQKQLDVIARLTRNCHMIVNAMDSAVEGELIYGNIASFLNLTDFPTKRLWTASLQPAAIKKAYEEMKDISEYRYLQNAGLARSMSDYILGINSTRSLTLAGGGITLAAGRILTPTLALVYDRQQTRENFKEEIYYTIKATFKQDSFYYDANFKGERLTEIEEYEKIIRLVEKQEGQVQFEDKTTVQMPPLLPNLTDITAMANQRYGFKVAHTAKILQKIYLKKYITYPRTNSRYVTADELDLMHNAFKVLAEVYPNLKKGSNVNRLNSNNKRVVDPQGVQDHHAILPEATVPTDLSQEEEVVYQLIVERFFLQFQEPATSLQRKVITTVADYHFHTSFKKIDNYGWKGLELNFDHDYTEDDEITEEMAEEIVDALPKIYTDRAIENFGIEPKERKTSAPGLYTEGALMKLMENISGIVADKKLKEILKDCGIGTSATRADTIKKLQDNGYVASHKKKLEVTKLGKKVIELIRKSKTHLLTSPELTATWELELEEIKKGKDIGAFQEAVKNFTMNFVEEMREIALSEETLSTFSAKCPNCSKPIKTNKNAYYCTNNKHECSFFLWKKQYNKTISQKMVDDLITNGETNLLTFSRNDGQKYKARFKMTMPLENGKLQLAYI